MVRTSTKREIPCSFSIPMNSSIGRVEWPMVLTVMILLHRNMQIANARYKKFLLYAPLARQYTEDDFFHVACSRIGAGSEACPLQVNLATNTCCSRAMVCLRSPVWRRFSALA